MTQSRDQILLSKLYECQDLILNICEGDIKDEKYIVISEEVKVLNTLPIKYNKSVPD